MFDGRGEKCVTRLCASMGASLRELCDMTPYVRCTRYGRFARDTTAIFRVDTAHQGNYPTHTCACGRASHKKL